VSSPQDRSKPERPGAPDQFGPLNGLVSLAGWVATAQRQVFTSWLNLWSSMISSVRRNSAAAIEAAPTEAPVGDKPGPAATPPVRDKLEPAAAPPVGDKPEVQPARPTRPVADTPTADTHAAETPAAERPTDEDIRTRAYEIYLRRGGQPGDAQADWAQAEAELRER
jgi:hypothetical protein